MHVVDIAMVSGVDVDAVTTLIEGLAWPEGVGQGWILPGLKSLELNLTDVEEGVFGEMFQARYGGEEEGRPVRLDTLRVTDAELLYPSERSAARALFGHEAVHWTIDGEKEWVGVD